VALEPGSRPDCLVRREHSGCCCWCCACRRRVPGTRAARKPPLAHLSLASIIPSSRWPVEAAIVQWNEAAGSAVASLQPRRGGRGDGTAAGEPWGRTAWPGRLQTAVDAVRVAGRVTGGSGGADRTRCGREGFKLVRWKPN